MARLGRSRPIPAHVTSLIVLHQNDGTAVPAAIALSATIASPTTTAPGYRGTGTSVFWNGSNTPQSIANPTGTVAGDLLVLLIRRQYNMATTITSPDGWVVDQTDLYDGTSYVTIYHRIATLGTLDTPTLTPPASWVGAAVKFALSGVNISSPMTSTTNTSVSAATAVAGPALTAVTPSMGVSIAVHFSSGIAWNAASIGTTQLSQTNSVFNVQIVTQSGAGAVGSVTHNWQTSDTGMAFGILANGAVTGGLGSGDERQPGGDRLVGRHSRGDCVRDGRRRAGGPCGDTPSTDRQWRCRSNTGRRAADGVRPDQRHGAADRDRIGRGHAGPVAHADNHRHNGQRRQHLLVRLQRGGGASKFWHGPGAVRRWRQGRDSHRDGQRRWRIDVLHRG